MSEPAPSRQLLHYAGADESDSRPLASRMRAASLLWAVGWIGFAALTIWDLSRGFELWEDDRIWLFVGNIVVGASLVVALLAGGRGRSTLSAAVLICAALAFAGAVAQIASVASSLATWAQKQRDGWWYAALVLTRTLSLQSSLFLVLPALFAVAWFGHRGSRSRVSSPLAMVVLLAACTAGLLAVHHLAKIGAMFVTDPQPLQTLSRFIWSVTLMQAACCLCATAILACGLWSVQRGRPAVGLCKGAVVLVVLVSVGGTLIPWLTGTRLPLSVPAIDILRLAAGDALLDMMTLAALIPALTWPRHGGLHLAHSRPA